MWDNVFVLVSNVVRRGKGRWCRVDTQGRTVYKATNKNEEDFLPESLS